MNARFATLCAAGLLGASACVTTRDSGKPESREATRVQRAGVRDPAGTEHVATPAAARTPDGAFTAEKSVADRASAVVAEVHARGSIEWDQFTVPLVNPDGTLLAVQSGWLPAPEMMAAEDGTGAPIGAQIDIYLLDPQSQDEPSVQTQIAENVLLGRSADARGFLVEAPQEDGSRWIGLADWGAGIIQWLVQSPGTVAAFAALGHEGALAWSQRRVGELSFDLVVDRGGDRWSLPGDGRSWLLPTWSGTGNGLFALALEGESLWLVHLDASDLATARRTIRRLALADTGADVQVALQCAAISASAQPSLRSSVDQLAFHHPTRHRAAVWRPRERALLLDTGSLAAVIDPANSDYALVVGEKSLFRRSFVHEHDEIDVVKGLTLPRATTGDARKWILFSPARDGRLNISVLHFLKRSPIDEEDS